MRDSARRSRQLVFGLGAGAAVLLAAAALMLTGALSAQARHGAPRPARLVDAHAHPAADAHARALDQGTAPDAAQISADVDRLLSKMTVAEKFGQLTMAGPDGANGTPGPKLLAGAANGSIGSVLDLVGVQNIDQVQHAAMQSRLHIPMIFSLDVIHGYKTIFPVPLAEASSWDPTLARADERVSASEATADGIKWTFNPMVDITRDARWGRVVEGAGEDPYLGSAIAAAKVRGYQGPDFSAPDRMAATVKHFGGYGAPVAGREYNTVDMSTQQLFNDYLPPYKAATDAGVATVMSSFNSLNGVPNTANPYLLRKILRREWHYGGTVVSDYEAVQELQDFGYAADQADAARLALSAGVEIEMAVDVPSEYSTYDNNGPQLLRSGQLTMAQVDRAVRHVLTLKYLAGMFAHPYTDPSRVQSAELTPTNLAAARASAGESMVLLNDKSGALPLSSSLKSLAVVGPLADDAQDQLGPDVPIGYDVTQGKVTTVLAGLKSALPQAQVSYAQGCDAACASDGGFGAAVDAAKGADATVVVVGEPASDSGEASSRSNITLPGDQEQLVAQIAATGKPYVVVLMNGRPLQLNSVADAPGLLDAWYPGTEGGDAVADVLLGKVDPSGKLPMSFPRDVGQEPISYNELPTGRPADPSNKYTSRYLDVDNSPQYPFGYGLSYTSFDVSAPKPSATSVRRDGSVKVAATVSNTGQVAGTDVVQLYVHEADTPILQPVRKLEGFQRVTLAPGQHQRVTFTLDASNLGYYDNDGNFTESPGTFDVWVADRSDTGQPATFTQR